MLDVIKENMEDYVSDKALKSEILPGDPVPSNIPRVKKLDEFMTPFVSKYLKGRNFCGNLILQTTKMIFFAELILAGQGF